MRIGLKIYNTDWLYMFNVVRLAPTSPDQATCPNGIKPDGPIVNASGSAHPITQKSPLLIRRWRQWTPSNH